MKSFLLYFKPHLRWFWKKFISRELYLSIYSCFIIQSSPCKHSHKRPALVTTAILKPCLHCCLRAILISNQLQLQQLFLISRGGGLWELWLYFKPMHIYGLYTSCVFRNTFSGSWCAFCIGFGYYSTASIK